MGKYCIELSSNGRNKNSRLTCRTPVMLGKMAISDAENEAGKIMNNIKCESHRADSLEFERQVKTMISATLLK